MSAKIADPWKFFEHTKPNPGDVCAVVIWEELPFADPVPALYKHLVTWDGLNWINPDGTRMTDKVSKWKFMQLSKIGPIPDECCMNCKFFRDLHHNYEYKKGFVESYCCIEEVNMTRDKGLVIEVKPSDKCEGFEKK